MKKLIVIILAFLFSSGIRAQQNISTTSSSTKPAGYKPRNELRLNLASSLASFPQVDYEGFIDENISLGISLGAAMESYENLRLRALIMPYARVYFSSIDNAGFFIEANIAYAHFKGTEDPLLGTPGTVVKNYSNPGFGVALGWKFITKKNFVGEFFGGVGRVFGESLRPLYPRIGISLGKRF